MERRLSAIVAADVVGYSRLIRADEEGTIAALQALRADLIDPKLSEHNGRIVKLMGDGMLVEFSSVVDAVRAAVATQKALAEHNSSVPENKRIEFRIGINLGDVVIDGDDIQGDGVNVAARLEGLAQTGGICISDGVHEQVRDRLEIPFEDLGEKEVKNIARPVRVWQWLPTASIAAVTTAVDAPLPLPDKPSIAVLPFDNMSDERDQEFFADGMTEDIITELSKFNTLLVIARNSTFVYKGQAQAQDLTAIGRELGVRYLVEGSVRKAGKRVRITAQLIDAEGGHHLWADRFDGVLEDIFDMQDQVTMAVAGSVGVSIDKYEIDRLQRQRPENMAAWELVLQASVLEFTTDEDENRRATELCRQAIALEPRYARAYAHLAVSYWAAAFVGWAKNGRQTLDEALGHAQTAFSLDQNEPSASNAMALCHISLGNMDKALEAGRRAIAIAPCSLEGRRTLAMVLGFKGETAAALEQLDFVARLTPGDRHSFIDCLGRANAYFTVGNYAAACQYSESARELWPHWVGTYWVYAAAAALSGELELAQELVKTATVLRPHARLQMIRRSPMFTQDKVVETLVEGLRIAGLPD